MPDWLKSIFSWENLKSIVLAIALAIVLRSCAFELFRIPSGSMKDNLLIGDVLIVSKYPYGYGKYFFVLPLPIDKAFLAKEPKRGDIIVFRKENDDGKNYIKRLIGLPGDTIEIKKGVIFINDKAIKREKTKEEKEDGFIYQYYQETLPNNCSYEVRYNSIVNSQSFPDTTPRYQVPEGYFFFMGDNRNHSVDSRFISDIGLIPSNNIIGRAENIVWTSDMLSLILRGDFSKTRFFESLRCQNND